MAPDATGRRFGSSPSASCWGLPPSCGPVEFVQTVVYGLSPIDPLTIGAVAVIAGVTALAGGVPARRASNVNPIEALRQQ